MKKKIIIENEKIGIPVNFTGISSCEKDYRVSIEINKYLGINLKQNNPNNLAGENNEEKISIFSYFDEENEVSYLLFSNKTLEGKISSKYKNIDFFFVVTNNSLKSYDEINKLLKNSKIISGSYTLKTDANIKKILKNYL